ncbi:diacylglycerol kinase family protein [Mesobacillus maritimus]|uniref:Diacylglycerol kinase family protein n=1 Tax=Mesobacillus maritimus TaxID=1643336 RepID=A0ABS7K239_9BACI|nr:diacylglycerol kinase family protein [Mesobacillus maritimus]MBY0096334.1 diacylglycerol kinase family protein [Mesobacillus maritimus]
MSMGSPDRNHKKKITLLRSFYYAISGISSAIKTERNLRIHLTLSLLVIFLGFAFSITRIEWLIVILVLGGMLCAELINTAIERVVDLATEEYHPLAKQAKDIAAGAVLLFAVTSVVVGIVIFVPRILSILSF